MKSLRKGATVEILVGAYKGKKGKIAVVARDVPKNLGVVLDGLGALSTAVWFTVDEVKRIDGEQ